MANPPAPILDLTKPQAYKPAPFWRRLLCVFGQHDEFIHSETRWSKTSNGITVAQGPMFILQCWHCGNVRSKNL